MQHAHTSTPVLTAPSVSAPFTLDTDLRNKGMGVVLSQRTSEEGEQVVTFYNIAVSKAERNYCVTWRELLAVMEAIKHYRPYLCGCRFVLRTDHAALQWLLCFREPKGQIPHWLEMLQSYELEIQYRPGVNHSNFDALSKRLCSEVGFRYCNRKEAQKREPLGEDSDIVIVRELQTLLTAEW